MLKVELRVTPAEYDFINHQSSSRPVDGRVFTLEYKGINVWVDHKEYALFTLHELNKLEGISKETKKLIDTFLTEIKGM